MSESNSKKQPSDPQDALGLLITQALQERVTGHQPLQTGKDFVRKIDAARIQKIEAVSDDQMRLERNFIRYVYMDRVIFKGIFL